MLWFSVILSLVASVLGCGEEITCPPSNLQIVIRSHRNLTSSWQTSSMDQGAASQNPWKMIVEHRSIMDGDGYSILETTIHLKGEAIERSSTHSHTHLENIFTLEAQGTNPNSNIVDVGEDKPKSTPEQIQAAKASRYNYQHYPGVGYYKYHSIVANWPTAREICAHDGGHLVIINSEAERQVVREIFAAKSPAVGSSDPDQIHAGLQRTVEGKHVTIFEIPIERTGFQQWHPGQPSSGAMEPCVSIMKKYTTYNDISCSLQKLAFICEMQFN